MLGVHEHSCRSVQLVCRHQCRRDRASSWEIIRKQEQEHMNVRCIEMPVPFHVRCCLVVPLSSCVAISVIEIVPVPGRSFVNKTRTHMLGVHESSCRSVELVCRHQCQIVPVPGRSFVNKNKNTHVRCHAPSCCSVQLVCRHQ